MLATIEPKLVFGAQKVASTKGPHWRIRQVAGFLLSGNYYSLRFLIQNLTGSYTEVTIDHGISSTEPGTATTFQLAPGAVRLIALPASAGGQWLQIKTQYEIALLSVAGAAIDSSWSPVAAPEVLTAIYPAIKLKKQQFSWSGTGAAGATAEFILSPAAKEDWTYLFKLSTPGQVQLLVPGQSIIFTGYCNWLLDETTSDRFTLVTPAPTFFSLEIKEFVARGKSWEAASGATIWNV